MTIHELADEMVKDTPILVGCVIDELAETVKLESMHRSAIIADKVAEWADRHSGAEGINENEVQYRIGLRDGALMVAKQIRMAAGSFS